MVKTVKKKKEIDFVTAPPTVVLSRGRECLVLTDTVNTAICATSVWAGTKTN